MNKFNKLWGLMAIVLILFYILTACGDKKPAQTKNEGQITTKTTSTEPTELQLPKVKLSWFTPVATLPKEEDTLKVQAELNKYLLEKIHAEVSLNYMSIAGWKQKSPVMLASGDYMDIVFTAGWSGYRQSVAQGVFVDITDMFDTYLPKTKALLPAAYMEGTKVAGKNYCVPTNKDLAHTYGLLYRTDIAEKYNLDFSKVKAMEDLEPILRTLLEKEPDVYPLMVAGGSTNNSELEQLNFDPVGDATIPGKLYPNKDYKVINEFETPEAMQYFKTMHNYYKKGYIRKDAATITDNNQFWNSGKVYITKTQGKPFVDEDTSISRGYPYRYIEFTEPYITGNDTQGSNHAVYRTSKHVARSLMFLELVNTDKYVNNLLNFGIENVHYVKKSENLIGFAPGLDAKTSGYYPNAFWIFGNQFLNYFVEGQNTQRWEAYTEFNNNATPSKILGFDFNQEPVKTEIAACANVLQEFNKGLNTGKLNPEEYLPILNEKLKQAGLNTVIAEKQKQLDAWLAAGKK